MTFSFETRATLNVGSPYRGVHWAPIGLTMSNEVKDKIDLIRKRKAPLTPRRNNRNSVSVIVLSLMKVSQLVEQLKCQLSDAAKDNFGARHNRESDFPAAGNCFEVNGEKFRVNSSGLPL